MLGANEAFKLRNAERAAKQAKAGLWKNHVAPASAGTRLSDRFQGPVVEVASGDCLVVLDTASGAQHTPLPQSGPLLLSLWLGGLECYHAAC